MRTRSPRLGFGRVSLRAMAWVSLSWILAPGAVHAEQGRCPGPVVRAPATASPLPGWKHSTYDGAAEAVRANQEADALVLARRYDEADRLLARASALDPGWLMPRLRRAGLLVRRDRLHESARVLGALLEEGFVPYERLSREAVDLVALWARADETGLSPLVKEASRTWSAYVRSGVLLVSRLRPAVKLASEDGPLPLLLNQEVVSWNAETGRYFQVTAERGQVLVARPTADNRALLFLTATRVRRHRGSLRAFEGVVVHWLSLDDLNQHRRIPIADPVAVAAVGFAEDGGPTVTFENEGRRWSWPTVAEDIGERQGRGGRRAPGGRIRLTVDGVGPSTRTVGTGPCRMHLEDDPAKRLGPTVKVRGVPPRRLPSPHGLALFGLPLPGEATPLP
ncbi:MAG: hypothetical protein KA712_22565 [Myxococcales bacterium]|nr:hypothetical protein [Myxococcales bacterium]